MITLEIPIKPYLKKYLTKKYGEVHQVKKNSLLGGIIIDVLDKQYRKQSIDVDRKSWYKVSVPATIVKEVGFDISFLKLKKLAEKIYTIFYNDLETYIKLSIENDLKFHNEKHDSINKQNRLKAIAQFLDFYNITEEELKLDSVYRIIERRLKSDK